MMKKLIIAVLLSAVGLVALAQTRAFNQKLFNAKLAEMVQQLHITEAQQPQFAKIYEDYSREMIRVWNENQPASSAELEQMRAEMARQEQIQSIRLRYLDRLSTVLADDQLTRFFAVEKAIQKRIKAIVQKKRA